MVRMFFFLLSSYLFKLILCVGNFASVTINTGTVRGHRLSLDYHGPVGGDHMDVFLGVPYARPPVGPERFSAPSPAPAWKGVHDATYYRPVCPQRLWYIQGFSFGDSFNNTSEDCLYLNIFSPKISRDKLPVMVWIHGGAFTYGSGAEYDGRVLAMGGVVYVSINYRVGLMGFLSTGDSAAPGNVGHLDQIAALRWVRDNIGQFGGDPDKVTIFGQSSGGSSVSSHLFSPLAKGLFRGVIAHSGVALSPFAFYRPPYKARDTAFQLGRKNGCTQTSSLELVKCLSRKPIDDLLNTRVDGPPMSAPYVPVVDGHYIRDLPETLLSRGHVTDVPLMTGTVPKETADELEYITGIERGIDAKDTAEKVRYYSSRYGNKSDVVYKALNCHYNLHSSDPLVNRENLIDFQSDYGYHAPHIRLADGLAKLNNTVFYYSFEYRSPNMITPLWEGVLHSAELYYVFGCPFSAYIPCPWNNCNVTWCTGRKANSQDQMISRALLNAWTNFAKHSGFLFGNALGVLHSAELYYVFGCPFSAYIPCPWNNCNVTWCTGRKANSQDQMISRALLNAWTNFAKHSDPNPGALPNGMWPSYQQTSQEYLQVRADITVQSHYKHKQMQFWNKFLPQLLAGTKTDACPNSQIVG